MLRSNNLLITGYAGTPHVTSEQQGACNVGMWGAAKYVLNVGNQFAYEIVSNNLIKVQDGYAMNQGRLMGVGNALYEEMIIDNGLQGTKRADLICMKYTKNADTGVENVEMVVVKGTSGDDYADPSVVSGDILAGASEDDFPLYRVKIDGINIAAVEPLFNIMLSAQELTDKIGTTNISSIGSGTVTGAISALNGKLASVLNGVLSRIHVAYVQFMKENETTYSATLTDIKGFPCLAWVAIENKGDYSSVPYWVTSCVTTISNASAGGNPPYSRTIKMTLNGDFYKNTALSTSFFAHVYYIM